MEEMEKVINGEDLNSAKQQLSGIFLWSNFNFIPQVQPVIFNTPHPWLNTHIQTLL